VDSKVNSAAGSQDQNWCWLTSLPHSVNNGQSIDAARQHPVQNQHVPTFAQNQTKNLDPVAAPDDRETGFFEAVADILGRIRIILNYQTASPAVPAIIARPQFCALGSFSYESM
jgi:hypothetical protein